MSKVLINLEKSREVVITHEDIMNYLVDILKNPRNHSYPIYGYDLYVHTIIVTFFKEKYRKDDHEVHRQIQEISPLFIDSCWEFCRRGILRPYPHYIGGQGVPEGAGFSITSFGRQWLDEENFDIYVPTDQGHFSLMLKPYAILFGDGFQERAQEAIRCYNAHAYLACCSMAGAAAESILIKIAEKLNITRRTNEPITRTREAIISNSPSGIKEGLIAYSDIIKYWRDEGMHHESWETRGEKAYISLAMLLRLAIFAKDKWF